MRTAKRHGFDAIEVFPSDGRSPELAPLKMLLRNHELSLAAMGTGLDGCATNGR